MPNDTSATWTPSWCRETCYISQGHSQNEFWLGPDMTRHLQPKHGEEEEKTSVQNKAQAVSAGCMEQHFPQNPATVLTVDDFTATKLVYRFQMLRFALLINAFISDLYYKITGSPIVQICFSAAYVKLRECWLICSLSAKVQHQQILWLAVQAVQLTLK